MNGFILAQTITFLAIESGATNRGESVISLDLEPSALLHHDRYIKGHRKLKAFGIADPNITDSDPESPFLPHLSFHPYTNGVYSSIVELDEDRWNETIYTNLVREHNEGVRKYNAGRHLSRYELFHRQKFGVDRNQTNSTHAEKRIELMAEYKKIGQHRSLQNAANLRRPPLIDEGNGEINEQLVGGLYNDFQSAPLSQGYGTHYATVW